MSRPIPASTPQRGAEAAPCYPFILPGCPVGGGAGPVVSPGRRRAASESAKLALPASGLKLSASTDAVRLTQRSGPAPSPRKAAQRGAPRLTRGSAPAGTAKSATTTSTTAAITTTTSTTVTTTTTAVTRQGPGQLPAAPSPRRAPKPRAIQRKALLAAASLFLLSRDTLRQPWLRASDTYAIGRNLSAARSVNKERAKAEFNHRMQQLAVLVDLVRDTATGRKLLECLQAIAQTSRDGDGKYLRPNRSPIKGERHGDKSELRDRLLSKKGQRMVDGILVQFECDPLSPALRQMLHTCDCLLVNWYQESRRMLTKAHEQPDLAFLDMTRRSMMISALVTSGLMKLQAQVSAPHALGNITAVTGAAMRRICQSSRWESWLRRSAMGMAGPLKSVVLQGQALALRYEVLSTALMQQGVDRQHCSSVWRWLTRLQDVLCIPDLLRPSFEQAALASKKLADFAEERGKITDLAMFDWFAAALASASEPRKVPRPLTVDELAQMVAGLDNLNRLDRERKLLLQGFE